MELFDKLDANERYMREAFAQCDDFVNRRMTAHIGRRRDVCVMYIDMLANARIVDMSIISRLMPDGKTVCDDALPLLEAMKAGGISVADLEEARDFETVLMAIMSGDTAVFVDGYDCALIVSSRGFPNRGVPSAEVEVVVQGSHEAFSEVFRINTALLRRRIRDTRLKIEQSRVGRRSGTDVALVYLEDVARPAIVQAAADRLGNIDIDAVLDIGYIEQFIEDDWLSPFPQTQLTERPDKAASAILEGRVVILADNSPFAMILPTTFNAFFQASEDYYQRFQIMSLVRLIRFAAAFLAVALPGLYIALAVFHPSMLPMMLMLKMAGARAHVPFPAVLEILMMELAFELLREAGVRLPGPIGGTIGIVGGLIVGQAAVEAGLVSPIVVIVAAITGIAGFAVPHYSLVSGFRLMKYVVILFSAFLGLFGFWTAAFLILIHLASLKSFGVPYLLPFAAGGINRYEDAKDTLFRLPLFAMKKRPFFADPAQRMRLKLPRMGNKRGKE